MIKKVKEKRSSLNIISSSKTIAIVAWGILNFISRTKKTCYNQAGFIKKVKTLL